MPAAAGIFLGLPTGLFVSSTAGVETVVETAGLLLSAAGFESFGGCFLGLPRPLFGALGSFGGLGGASGFFLGLPRPRLGWFGSGNFGGLPRPLLAGSGGGALGVLLLSAPSNSLGSREEVSESTTGEAAGELSCAIFAAYKCCYKDSC